MGNPKSEWRPAIFQNPTKKYDKHDLLYHSYNYERFGIVGNFRILLCRTLGHRVSDCPEHNSCARCGLAYEEIYHDVGKGWFQESGIHRENVLELNIQNE